MKESVSIHSAAGGKHSMALTVDGRVFSWGEGDDGKLGHCSRLSCDTPRLIEALKSKRIRDIACGSSHSAAISSSGELFTWGCGEYGRLGHGDNASQWRPKQVMNLKQALFLCNICMVFRPAQAFEICFLSTP